MRIIRSPLRISLFGGGTDSFAFCQLHGSTIVSFALSCSIYVTHNRRPTGGYRVSYSEVEELEYLDEAKHTLVQAIAKCVPFPPCTITIVSDVPKGTGLGSSSALMVALAKLANWDLRGSDLVRTAFDLERSVSPGVGWQDYLPAVYGGFNIYHIQNAKIEATPVPDVWNDIISEYGLLLYTGRSRDSASVLSGWKKDNEHLLAIKTLADEVVDNIMSITNVERLSRYLHKTWELKNQIEGVSDVLLNAQYDKALELGALSGKICGAGAGGCWFFLVPPQKRRDVVDGLGLVEVPFEIQPDHVMEWSTDVRF